MTKQITLTRDTYGMLMLAFIGGGNVLAQQKGATKTAADIREERSILRLLKPLGHEQPEAADADAWVLDLDPAVVDLTPAQWARIRRHAEAVPWPTAMAERVADLLDVLDGARDVI